jgi:hypothetical protein
MGFFSMHLKSFACPFLFFFCYYTLILHKTVSSHLPKSAEKGSQDPSLARAQDCMRAVLVVSKSPSTIVLS